LAYKIRGGAPDHEIRRPASSNRSKTQHKHDRRESAIPSAVEFWSDRSYVAHHTAPRVPVGRVRPGGFLVYALVVLAAFYLAGHVGAALLGWRIVAICALTLIWLGLTGWSWATARTWSRRTP
jgi:hypothetical protein